MSRSRRPQKFEADKGRSDGGFKQRTFLATGALAREMDFPSRSASERAAHDEQEAEKFRRMAAAEPVEHIREELIRVAEQYQRPADSLNTHRRFTTE